MSCHDLPCSYIPYEVVVEILIRVPKRTLARFKWVCREWQHMICHDSWFHEMRRNFKIICTRPHQPAWILRMSDNRFSGRRKVSCEMKDCSEQGTLIKEFVLPHYYICNLLRDPPTPNRSANLLFYHTIYDHTYLYDIKTDRVQELPRASTSYGGSLSKCGFGYSWKHDEYKVVHLYKKERDANVINCEVYSTRKGSWRNISEECPCEVLVYQNPVVINDRIHWICDECIVSFDLNDEKFTTMPFSDPEQYYVYGYLAKLKGRLCLVSPPFSYIDQEDQRLRVWAVKDYCQGTWECWCNISLCQFMFSNQRFYVSQIFKVAYVGNEELVFVTCFGKVDYREVYCDMREGGRITRVVPKAYGPIIFCGKTRI